VTVLFEASAATPMGRGRNATGRALGNVPDFGLTVLS
jgi:hypothetical protein